MFISDACNKRHLSKYIYGALTLSLTWGHVLFYLRIFMMGTPVISLYFTDGEAKAERGHMTFHKSHSVEKLSFEPTQPGLNTPAVTPVSPGVIPLGKAH